jgi:hypothetical protein
MLPRICLTLISGQLSTALHMPMIMVETSIAAGAVNANLFSGSAFEFARARGVVSIGVAQAATGMFCTLQAGADIIAEEFSLPILTRFPIIPDEMYFTDVVESGDRLVARVRNPTAGAIVARAVVQMSAGG